jgi:predicted DNA binding CopG/RHH family protein
MVALVTQAMKESILRIRCSTETKRKFKAYAARVGLDYEGFLNYLIELYEKEYEKAVKVLSY